MLELEVVLSEDFDEIDQRFVQSTFTLEFEHSLVSLSKWESTFEKPFLGDAEKTVEETTFYIEKCMLLTKNPPEGIFSKLSKTNYDEIQDYINSKQSATWFKEPPGKGGGPRQIITAAVIYGWMIALKIPYEMREWHLNELFTQIKVCNEQTKPPKKMGRAEAARQQAALNAQRRAQMGTGG